MYFIISSALNFSYKTEICVNLLGIGCVNFEKEAKEADIAAIDQALLELESRFKQVLSSKNHFQSKKRQLKIIVNESNMQ